MALLNRNTSTWLIRTLGALTVAFAALAGMTSPAFAGDDDEVVTYGPNACTVVSDMPAYPSATCIKHKTELDDGVIETTNKYLTADSADVVRRAFEQAFVTHGWTVVEAEQDVEDQEWDYTVVKGLRRIKLEVEAREPDEGIGTEFTLEVQ